MSTTSKYALVTGGSRGIGRAIAERLACDGYYVVINYKSNDEAAQQILQTILQNTIREHIPKKIKKGGILFFSVCFNKI